MYKYRHMEYRLFFGRPIVFPLSIWVTPLARESLSNLVMVFFLEVRLAREKSYLPIDEETD